MFTFHYLILVGEFIHRCASIKNICIVSIIKVGFICVNHGSHYGIILTAHTYIIINNYLSINIV